MKRLLSAATSTLALLAAGGAQAGALTDTITDAYWGADAHTYTDVIGDSSTYNINDAKITRVGDVLTITIGTSFAGKAGSAPTAYRDASGAYKGIGYGDVFLSDTWSAVGSTNHYLTDNSTTGTVWDYGFNLWDRWNNGGTDFTLYKLNGITNAANINNSDKYINCTNCTFRNGQETAVKTYSSPGVRNTNVFDTGKVGHMTVLSNALQFTINVSGTDLATFSSLAMHWGETCQNDVIEGMVHLTPIPGTLPLLALGLAGLAMMRRRRQG